MGYEESLSAHTEYEARIEAFSDKVDAMRLRPLRFILRYPSLYLEASRLRREILNDKRLQFGELAPLLFQLHSI